MDLNKIAKLMYDHWVKDRKGIIAEGKPFPHWVNLDPAEQARWTSLAETAYRAVREELSGVPVR